MSLLIEVEPEPPPPPDDGVLFVDRRLLAFRAPALLHILSALWMDGGVRMSARNVRFVTSKQLVLVGVDLSGKRILRSLRAHDLLPLLISWCIGARVPLPAHAEKSVRVTPGGVVLNCTAAHLSLPEYHRRRAAGPRVVGEWER